MKGVVRAPAGGAAVAGLLVLLAAAAASSRTRLFHEGEPPLSTAAARLLVDLSTYLFLGLLLLSFAIMLWALWPRDADGPEPPRRSLRSLLLQMLGSAVMLAATLLLLAELRARHLLGSPVGGGTAGVGTPPPGPLLPGVERAPAAFDWAAAALAALTLALAAGFAGRRLLGARRSDRERRALARALDQVLGDTLEDLRLDRDPRRAVIQAYARFEHVLALHGAPRRPADAPLEHVARALRELAVPASSARRLADLFEVARFSTHRVSTGMRDQAVGCLAEVRAALVR